MCTVRSLFLFQVIYQRHRNSIISEIVFVIFIVIIIKHLVPMLTLKYEIIFQLTSFTVTEQYMLWIQRDKIHEKYNCELI